MVFNSNDLTLLESRYVGISEKIVELQEKYNENLSIFNSDIVISHRDIDQKNVLWDNKNNAMIIDWEAS
jgi:thiamine kinase-like enzyme